MGDALLFKTDNSAGERDIGTGKQLQQIKSDSVQNTVVYDKNYVYEKAFVAGFLYVKIKDIL